MTTKQADERLFWHHIENGDYEGAEQHKQSLDELLKTSADRYLTDAVEAGEVTRSRIFMSNQLGKFVGYTTVETASGVKILKTSRGDFNVSVEYEERVPGTRPGDYQDLKVEIDLPAEGTAQVREERHKVQDFERTGDGSARTLSRNGGERVMGEVAKLIWQVF